MAALLVLWLAGTAGWSALALRRTRCFGRLLRFAEPAPDWLREEVATLAGRLGLRRAPTVWLVPGRLPPMLWALGGAPRLLLPAGLLESLTPQQRATLLLHELAHLRRRDHWVRVLEILVTGLFWWHPVVWWARRELREAEEQCCDAWVVWALPGAGRTYATALLECLDFLSDAPAPLPLGASGLGHTDDLKRRLTMIVRGTTPRRLTWGGTLALLVLGGLLLPAAFGQEGERSTREERPRNKLDENQVDHKDVARARAEVDKLKRELDGQLRRLRATEDRLRQAAARLGKLTGKGGDPRGIRIIYPGDLRATPPSRVESRPPAERPTPLPDAGPVAGPVVPPPPLERPNFTPAPVPVPPVAVERTVPRAEGDRRIQELERKLDDVLRQLKELKRNRRGSRDSSGPKPASPATPAAR